MENKTNILHTSGKITLAFLAFVLMFVCWIGNVFPYGTQSGTTLDLRRGSRVTDYMFYQPFADTYTMYFGTQSVTGSGSTGYIPGTSTAFPRLQYNASALTFNFVGATLQNEGVDVTVSSDLSGYIAVTGGTGTGNVLTDTTLAGAGTISANVTLSGNITANSLLITPAELSSVNNATGEIQAQITTATGSITNHVHTGADGTAQIAHDSITGTGTNSHSTIDIFIASKAQASGLASLDTNSLVVQNPASGTSTPGASKTVMSDGSGKIADGWLNSTITALGQSIELGTETTGNTDNVAEGSSNLYYLNSRVNAAVGSLSVNALNDVNIAFNENDFVKIVGGQLVAGSSSTTVAFSAVTGSATASQLPPISGLLGSATSAQLPTVIRLTGTTTSPEAGAYGQLYVQSSSSSSNSGGNDAYTTLLLRMDNPGTTTFVDSSASAFTITVNGNAIGTSSAKYGSGAGYFDGTGDYITTIDHVDLEPLAADFTVEAWVKTTTGADGQTPFAKPSGAAGNMAPYSVYVSGGNYLLYMSSNGTSWNVVSGGNMGTCTANVWTHLAISRQGSNIRYFKDGTQMGTTTSAATLHDAPYGVWIGGSRDNAGFVSPWTGYVDDFRFSKGISRYNTNFITGPHTGIYTQYAAKYIDPINGNTVFEILTPGTATTEASYIYNNVTTTVWGLGTNTAITSGTASGYYAGWTNRPIRVSAIDIASTKKIKENIKPMHIKPEQLEAESKAKPVYIAEKKPAWFADNEINYTYVGSNTATHVDTAAMESDYASYIELEWASDLNQNVYIEAVQKTQQKYFWGLFDKIQPKSWNPIDDLRMTRKGLVVEEVPDEIKGADGQSIDQMAVMTYQTLALQDLKDSIVDIMQALKDLSAAGTFTTKSIDARLEAMRAAQ